MRRKTSTLYFLSFLKSESKFSNKGQEFAESSYTKFQQTLALCTQDVVSFSFVKDPQNKKIITNIGEGKIDVEIIGITGHAISRQSPEFSSKGMIISVIIVINVVWFIFYHYTRRKR